MPAVGLTSDPVLELAFYSSISTDLGATSDSGMIYPDITCISLAAALEWHWSLKEGGHFIPIKCSLTCGLQACTFMLLFLFTIYIPCLPGSPPGRPCGAVLPLTGFCTLHFLIQKSSRSRTEGPTGLCRIWDLPCD